jgi:hypothetical protein
LIAAQPATIAVGSGDSVIARIVVILLAISHLLYVIVMVHVSKVALSFTDSSYATVAVPPATEDEGGCLDPKTPNLYSLRILNLPFCLGLIANAVLINICSGKSHHWAKSSMRKGTRKEWAKKRELTCRAFIRQHCNVALYRIRSYMFVSKVVSQSLSTSREAMNMRATPSPCTQDSGYIREAVRRAQSKSNGR